jgi:hypothetical protein
MTDKNSITKLHEFSQKFYFNVTYSFDVQKLTGPEFRCTCRCKINDQEFATSSQFYSSKKEGKLEASQLMLIKIWAASDAIEDLEVHFERLNVMPTGLNAEQLFHAYARKSRELSESYQIILNLID